MSLRRVAEKWLGARWLPPGLSVAAAVIMLPALKAGLGMDDLVQRSIQLDASRLPSNIRDTGFALRSGSLPVVLGDLFGFRGEEEAIRRARDYGLLPWWMRDDVKAALWRPLAAFSHWLDYRLVPEAPALMHAQNIAWFAGAVFVASILYRKLIGPGWVAGLAGLLFLLDKNSYFPVMFVANRGFVMSLFFGLICLWEHHRWRATRSRFAAVLSIGALVCALISNEAGVSALAFLIAYAAFLDPPGADAGVASGRGRLALVRREIRVRGRPVLPAVIIVVLWRAVYQSLGFGVANVKAYIDPSQEPLDFLEALGGRSLALLAGQLTGVAPEAGMALHPSIRRLLPPAALVLVLLVVVAALPLLRRDRVARFWFAAMVMALVPAATVVPLSKNLGFVAVAAFGWIAIWIGEVVGQARTLPPKYYRLLTRGICLALLLVHLPGAVAARIGLAAVTPTIFPMMHRAATLGDWPEVEMTDVVVVNSPCHLGQMAAPFLRAYERKPLPRTIRSLLPGGTALEIRRTDNRTLRARPAGPDIFAVDSQRPLDVTHVLATVEDYFRPPSFAPGCRTVLAGLEIEVMRLGPRGLPAEVEFRFALPLDAPSFRWLYFDWGWRGYREFQVPPVGQAVRVPGPG